MPNTSNDNENSLPGASTPTERPSGTPSTSLPSSKEEESADSITSRLFASLATSSVPSDSQLNEPLTGVTLERLMMGLPRRSMMPRVILSQHHQLEQFRFPRTKKRRIRNKWSNRPENWRKAREQNVYSDGFNMIVPPDLHEIVQSVQEALPKVNPTLAAITKMFGIF